MLPMISNSMFYGIASHKTILSGIPRVYFLTMISSRKYLIKGGIIRVYSPRDFIKWDRFLHNRAALPPSSAQIRVSVINLFVKWDGTETNSSFPVCGCIFSTRNVTMPGDY